MTKSQNVGKVRRGTRASAAKVHHASSPPEPLEPGRHRAIRAKIRTRASTAQERNGSLPLKPLELAPNAAIKAKPRTRTSTVRQRNGTPKAKPRTRASAAKERHSRVRTKALNPPKPGVGVASEGEYEIQRIVDYRSTPYGDEYKVVWADTWITADDLGGAKKALQDFKLERYGNVSKHPARNRVRNLPRVRISPTGNARSLGISFCGCTELC